jgi:hypothetical protein
MLAVEVPTMSMAQYKTAQYRVARYRMAQHTPTRADEVLALWCEFTRTDPASLDAGDRRAFVRRPQVAALADTPDAVLRDTAEHVCRGRSLPLERWLAGVRRARSTAEVTGSRAVGPAPAAPAPGSGRWRPARRASRAPRTR